MSSSSSLRSSWGWHSICYDSSDGNYRPGRSSSALIFENVLAMNSLQSRNLILRLHWLQYGNNFLCLHWLQYSHNILRLHWLQYSRRIAHLHWLQYRNHRYLITDLETIRCGLLSWNFWENLDPLIYEEAENGDFDINPSPLSLFNAIFLSLLSLNDYWLSSGLANTAWTPKVKIWFCNIQIYWKLIGVRDIDLSE